MNKLYLTISFLITLSITNFYKSQSEIWGVNPSGVNGLGSIYSLPTGSNGLSAQYSFTGNPGSGPQYTKLLEVPGGKLYGMTNIGGFNNLGVIFEYDTATNNYVKKVDLSTTLGSNPNGSLMRASNGKLYGMTRVGGANNFGVLFEYNITTNTYTKKVDFSGTTGSFIGAQPYGTLIESAPGSGKLIGMTRLGGANSAGVIFEYDYVNDIYTKTIDFTGTTGVAPGSNPYGQLYKAANGKFYGVTTLGGSGNFGVLFEYFSGAYNVKVNFTGLAGAAQGSQAQGSLMEAGSVLYGITATGGTNNVGVVYQYNYTTNIYTKLTDMVAANGSNSTADFVQATNGMLYGTTRSGGANSQGALFEYNPTGNVYTKKIDLSTANGQLPLGSMMQVSTGKLYGMTTSGGAQNVGAIYQYNIGTNTYTKKIDFNLSNGGNSNGGLMQASNGKLYGMAATGGTAASSSGVIFEYDKATQTYTKKFDFIATTGNTPYGSLIEYNSKLYGMTSAGGTGTSGTLFEYDFINNSFTKKIDFTSGTQGASPYGSLVQYAGKLYGVTRQGGANGLGTLFEYDPTAGTLTKKADMALATGGSAYGSMVESGGKLYGMTSAGGANNFGAIFEYDPATGIYSDKIDLTGTVGAAQGSSPYGSLAATATTGILYGMTKNGGANDLGVIFEYNVTSNAYTKKYDLTAAGGSEPWGSPIRTANNNLYGVTNTGGANGSGALFEYNITTGAYTKNIDFSNSTGNYPSYMQLLEICTQPVTPGAISSSANGLCLGDAVAKTFSISNVANATSYTWTVPAGASITSGNTTSLITANFSGLAAGTYTYGVASVNICGTGTMLSTGNLTVNSIPTVSVNNGVVCSGSPFVITPSGAATYTVQGGVFTVSPTANSTYTVNGTSSFGCVSANTATATVTVNTLPTIGVNNGAICSGASFTINPTGVITSTVSGGSLVVSPTSNTLYTIKGSDINGCVSANTATASVTVNPVPSISVLNGTLCLGKSVTITPTGAGAGGSYTLNGTPGAGPFILSPTSTTSYTVAGTNSFNCVSTNTPNFSVTVYTLPVISVANGTLCATKSVTLTPSGAGASGTYTLDGTAGTGSFVRSPASTINYTVAGTNSLGCVSSNTATAAVTVYSLPVISVGTATICAGQTYTLIPNGALSYTISGPTSGTAFPVSPAVSTSYTIAGTSPEGCVSSLPATANMTVYTLPTLSVSSGSICSGRQFTIIASGGASYTIQPMGTVVINSLAVSPSSTTNYTVLGVSNFGCASAFNPVSSVVVNPLPVVSTTNGAVCLGTPFTSSVSGASTYSYVTTVSTTTSNGSLTLTPFSTTTYSLYGSSPAGCSSTLASLLSLTVNPLPNVTITGTNAICEGETSTLTANGATTYNWGTSTNTVITANPLTSTTYTVAGTDLNGCSNLASFSLTVNQIPTITVISGAICPGNSYTLSPGGALTYTYSGGSNIVSPSTTTSYSVTGTSSAGCTATLEAVATVSVVNILTVTISGNTTICKGGTANLTANGASTYSWNNGSLTNTLAASPSSNTTYTVLGSSGTCSDVATIFITVNDLPNVAVTAQRNTICLGESADLSTSGATTYSWSTASTATIITVSPIISTIYTVTGTDANNCANSATISVLVSACTGIENYSGNAWQFGVYPNPNAGEFVIESSTGISITILNALGQTVLKQQLTEGRNPVVLNDQAKGIYFVQLKNGNTTKIVKIVKQ